MSYLHIPNLYKDPRILEFRRCYAMEKIHGTSAHISWRDGQLSFFSGGSSHENFVSLFEELLLREAFARREQDEVTVYGEAYGGKMQGMKETYGDKLRFIAFEVKVGDVFLDVPKAMTFATHLSLEFVAWREMTTALAGLDALRDAPSAQAARNGCGEKPREGRVLRPIFEVRLNNGERLIAKHKSDLFAERKRTPKVGMSLEVMQKAEAIADEWVVPERIRHVADALGLEVQVENIGQLIRGVKEDLEREAAGEIVPSATVWKVVGRKTAITVKEMCQSRLRSEENEKKRAKEDVPVDQEVAR